MWKRKKWQQLKFGFVGYEVSNTKHKQLDCNKEILKSIQRHTLIVLCAQQEAD